MERGGDSQIKIKFDSTRFRCLVTIWGKVEVGGRGVTLDLRDGNLKELIGFEREIIRESSFETKAPNITNGIDSLYIHCDLIRNSIADGKTKIREKSRKCHKYKPQPFPETKRKRRPTKPNKHKSK